MFSKIRNFLFKNTSSKQTVAKNTVWLTISNFGGRALKAIIIIYAARVLGTAQYGVLSYALTLAGFFTLFADPGINAILTRDASKGEDEKKIAIVSTTFVIKIIFLTIGAGVVLLVAPTFSTLPGAAILLPAAACIIVFDSLREYLFAFIRTREKMEWEAAAFLFTNVAIVVFGFIALAVAPTPLSLVWAYAAGSIAGAAAALYAVRKYLKAMFTHFSSRLIVPLMQAAWPFAITSTLGLLLTNTDILVISWMRTASDVGIYSAAIRIIQVLYLIPTIIQFSTLPLFSRLANQDNEKFRAVLERIIGILFLASIPLAVGGAILGTPIMKLVFGTAYASGGLPFKILMVTMLVDFPAAVIANAIFAYNHQKSLIITSVIGGVGNVVFDLLLIPRFGMAGSAVATLLAQTASNWYLWHMMKKINYFEVVPRLAKVAAAGIAMGIAAMLLLALGVNVIANVVICAALYGAILYLWHEPLVSEIRNIISPQPLG